MVKKKKRGMSNAKFLTVYFAVNPIYLFIFIFLKSFIFFLQNNFL